MPGDEAMPRLCRHMHSCGPKLCLRYSLSNGEYVGEIDVAVAGGAEMLQVVAYDLLSIASAAVAGHAAPLPGEERAAAHLA